MQDMKCQSAVCEDRAQDNTFGKSDRHLFLCHHNKWCILLEWWEANMDPVCLVPGCRVHLKSWKCQRVDSGCKFHFKANELVASGSASERAITTG